MPRPTDWDAIGLDGDPTPGDPDKIDELKSSMDDLGRVAREIDDALKAVLDKTSDAFVGQTADALREKISGPLREFVQSFATAFETSATALNTYVEVMREQQGRADAALEQGRGLAEDDSRREELANTARQAGEAQAEAGKTAGKALRTAGSGIKQPVSDCEAFWELFNWIAIALILPALIFGGPVALLAIGVNLTLFIKTAVDFAQGRGDLLGFFLSALGIIAPTTKAFPILQVITKAGKAAWPSVKAFGQSLLNFGRNLIFNLGRNSFHILPELRGFASFTGNWIRNGALWTLQTARNVPNIVSSAVHTGGFVITQSFRAIPDIVRAVPPTVIRAANTVWHFTVNNFGGLRWLRVVLPVDAAEISAHGFRGALRIGVVERGLLGRNVYGVPLLSAAGRGVSQIPLPPSLSQVDPLVDIPRQQLAAVRLGDWAGQRGPDLPALQLTNAGRPSQPSPFAGFGGAAGGPNLNISALGANAPGGLTTGTPSFSSVGALGDGLAMAPDSLRRLDALLDIPVQELNAVRNGDLGNLTFTSNGVRGDLGLNPNALNVNNPAVTTQPTNAPALAAAGSPNVTPNPATVNASVLSQGNAGNPGLQLTSLNTSLASPQATVFNATADLTTPGGATAALASLTPNPAPRAGLDLNLGTSAAPPQITATHAMADLSTPGGAGSSLSSLASGPTPQTALDLLATPPSTNNFTPTPLAGQTADPTTHALTANQVNLHLNTFTPTTAAHTTPPPTTQTFHGTTATSAQPVPTPTQTLSPHATTSPTPSPTATATTTPTPIPAQPTPAQAIPTQPTATSTPSPTTTASSGPPTPTHATPPHPADPVNSALSLLDDSTGAVAFSNTTRPTNIATTSSPPPQGAGTPPATTPTGSGAATPPGTPNSTGTPPAPTGTGTATPPASPTGSGASTRPTTPTGSGAATPPGTPNSTGTPPAPTGTGTATPPASPTGTPPGGHAGSGAGTAPASPTGSGASTASAAPVAAADIRLANGGGMQDLWVQVPPNGGARVVVDAAGTPRPHLRIEDVGGGNFQVSFTEGPRRGEFAVYDEAGRIQRQGFNTLKDGKVTPYMYVVDHTVPGGPTWQRMTHVDGAGLMPAGSGHFHHGVVKVSGDGSQIRLLGGMNAKYEVFERRILPGGGGVVDAFRRTDTVGFGRFSRYATWAMWDDTGRLVDHGLRKFDTSGFVWTDVDGLGRSVREFNTGLHTTGNNPGNVLAVKGADGNWTWHRFDGAGNQLASGPRTWEVDGGWVDRMADGAEVQRQWGKMHGPDKAGNYREYVWDAGNGGPGATWKQRSPQGKITAFTEQAGGTTLTVNRWSEQRPPLWVREYIVGVGRPEDSFRYLRGDTDVQIFSWTRNDGVNTTDGFRYGSQNGNVIDLAGDGRFVYAEMKLYDGGKLKVGAGVNAPDYAPPAGAANATPWRAGNQGGYRVPGGGGGAAGRTDLPTWQDVFLDNGQWRVAREGFPDGSVREYRTPFNRPPGGGAHPRPDGPWVQRDFHGNIVGRQDHWPNGNGHTTVTGTGATDSPSWKWREYDGQGNVVAEGDRISFRGSNDRSLPWDDSFRDLDANGVPIRGIDTLGGGAHVRYWRTASPAGDVWQVRKFDANGNVVGYGNGAEIRQWWNPQTRAWGDQWVGDAKHFRDVFRPADGGPQQVIREVPVHLDWTGGPLRIREYWADAGKAPVPGTWKEFDQGAVVRERTQLPDGTFLEKEPWRGQWRVYDADGTITAQRTPSGLVFEQGPDGMRLVGGEYDFHGPLTELRGWGRRIRELERLQWSGTASVDVSRFGNAIDGIPGLPAPQGGKVKLGEAAYQPYWKTTAQKMLLEFGQEFLLEFGINLAINGIVAAINNKPFTGQDALKAFANAAVASGIKTGASNMMNDRPFSWSPDLKPRLGNVDSGKHPVMRPYNSDKNMRNEWAGNESPARWRGGIYDYTFNALLSPITNFVNGAMNAAVWGVPTAGGTSNVLSGADALAVGGIQALSGLTVAVGAGALKTAVITGGDGRFWHRYGVGEYLLQAPFKLLEKSISTIWLAPALRDAFTPYLTQAPPTTSPSPSPSEPQPDPQPQPQPDPQSQP